MNSAVIDSHIKNYYSLVKSGQEFELKTLRDSFLAIKPILGDTATDYAKTRLPKEIENHPKIFFINELSQLDSIHSLKKNWQSVKSPNRRRFVYYNPVLNYLAFQLNSDSDIDDIINVLLSLNYDLKIQSLINNNFNYELSVKQYINDFIAKASLLDIVNKPIYFVSSNLHSLVNITSGFIGHYQNDIFNYIEKNLPDIAKTWEEIKNTNNVLRVNDFLYYISGKYFELNPDKLIEKKAYEYGLGFIQVEPQSCIDSSIQILPVKSIISNYVDPYLKVDSPDALKNSQAIIINIEYPLGQTAYYILKELCNIFNNIKGIYIMGKAAILSGDVGDVQIPNVVFDERTNNTFEISNIFNRNFPQTSLQSKIFMNQKAVSVHGTFLENMEQLTKYNSEGYNIIEMESGPYLNAIVEKYRDLNNLPFDFGIVNYASDNPLSQTLGEGSMNLKGIEPTYLSALAIIQRILDIESLC